MAAPGTKPERKGHVCPPSSATHPSDRWESLFVYSFILKFTNLKGKISGFESPMDFEEALMLREPNDILTKILGRFILNLKPQTRNLSTDQISTTLVAVLLEYLKTSERTVFWDDNLKANVDPFEGMECGFFAADWDLKLRVLRQLVELQLQHSQDIKPVIDRAWGVAHHKHKKEKGTAADSDGANLRGNLQMTPFGQDSKRERYWIADDSPRIYISTNPWKITATFKAICSTREEYLDVIEKLKSTAPEIKRGRKKTKMDLAHLSLIEGLENRLEIIDAELARVAKVRKKMEQNRLLMAQAELRETRTRRRSHKPDYVYFHQGSEDEADEYRYQEEHDDDDFEDDDEDERKRQKGAAVGTRRSTRAAVVNANGKREGSSESSWGPAWKGERRSARLGFQDVFEVERPQKRARTEESTGSVVSVESGSAINGQEAENRGGGEVKVKTTGAAGLRPNEVAMEQVAGKRKSKFWVYAVEPVSEPKAEGGPGEEGEVNGSHSPNGRTAMVA